MSLRTSMASPRSSSGLAYSGVSARPKLRVSEGTCVSACSRRATPKSSSRASPWSVTRMFDGFRSRWMTLRAWAKLTASSTCRKTADARGGIESPRLAPARERLALHVFHGDVGHAGYIDAGIVEAGDARIFQRGQDAAFAREAFGHLRGHFLQAGNLQRHLSLERPIGASRQPHLGHAANAQGAQQFVGAEPLTRLARGQARGRMRLPAACSADGRAVP